MAFRLFVKVSLDQEIKRKNKMQNKHEKNLLVSVAKYEGY